MFLTISNSCHKKFFLTFLGYVNPLNTTLEFDVTLYGWEGPGFGASMVRFQNNIQSIFQRVRLLYGATPSEDMINYNVITRALTEWTSTNQNGTLDQTSIAEGIGGYSYGSIPLAAAQTAPPNAYHGMVNTRQAFIQGISNASNTTAGPSFGAPATAQIVPNQQTVSSTLGNGSPQFCTRRYQVTFTLGLFNQDKLIPTKFMASQLAIEITLERPDFCFFSLRGNADTDISPIFPDGVPPTYGVGNVNLIPEILVFDASYGK